MGPKQFWVNMIVGPNVLYVLKQTNRGGFSYLTITLGMQLFDHSDHRGERIGLPVLMKFKQMPREIS